MKQTFFTFLMFLVVAPCVFAQNQVNVQERLRPYKDDILRVQSFIRSLKKKTYTFHAHGQEGSDHGRMHVNPGKGVTVLYATRPLRIEAGRQELRIIDDGETYTLDASESPFLAFLKPNIRFGYDIFVDDAYTRFWQGRVLFYVKLVRYKNDTYKPVLIFDMNPSVTFIGWDLYEDDVWLQSVRLSH